MYTVKGALDISSGRLKQIVAQFGGTGSIFAELLQAFILIGLIGLFTGLLIYYLNMV